MDSNYDPSLVAYEPSNAETTPSQRILYGKNMSTGAKRRVDRATAQLTAKRCLIEGTAESNHVDYAHCLRRSSKGELLDKLEFAWGMDRFTLNVDTRYNILRLSPKFHRAYDSGGWLLLPQTEIIEAYYAASTTGSVPIIDDGPYTYTLIAEQIMQEIPIHRQSAPPSGQPSQPAADDFTYYRHPYHSFPPIISHVHPRFIICNAGPKLQSDPYKWATGHEAHKDDLIKVSFTWSSWDRVVPTDIFLDKLSVEDDPDISDNNSEKTVPHRILRRVRPKRRREEQQSPTPGYSKQQGLSDAGTWLDEETLHDFEQQQLSSHTQSTEIKNQLILDWLGSVSDSGCIVEVKGKGDRDSSIAVDVGPAAGQDTKV